MPDKKIILEHLEFLKTLEQPVNLYEPIRYIMNIGGKRLRPILALMSSQAINGGTKSALGVAGAIEIFHNFSLVHDDVMDKADLRRGLPTVHKKWNLNTSILSGDAMMILAYQQLESYQADIFKSLASIFSKTALEVCEGQQMDIDFESRNDVSIDEYIEMIRLKTAVLLGGSLKMGVVAAEGEEEISEDFYAFGESLGLAFQLQDDYLDTFGNVDTFGKKIGGDILENKKTFLILKFLEKSNDQDIDSLTKWMGIKNDDDNKIKEVKKLLLKYEIDLEINKKIEEYTDKSLEILKSMTISDDKKKPFFELAKQLMVRIV